MDGHVKEPYEMSMALGARPMVPFLLTFYAPNLGSRTQKMTSLASQCINIPIQICTFPREDAGGLSREYVLRIPSVS